MGCLDTMISLNLSLSLLSVGLKPIATILLHCLASSGSSSWYRSWPVVEHALSPCSATPKNGDPLRASVRAGCLPVAAREKRTTGADTGADDL